MEKAGRIEIATQQQSDQIVAIKADERVQKDNIPGLDVSITMPVSVTVTVIINTVLGSIADESRPAEAAIAGLRTGMHAITYEQHSEIDMNEGSFDETLTTPIAGQGPKNYYNDHSVTVAKTVRGTTLSNSSSESRPVNVRSNMPVITTRDSEIDKDKGSSDSDNDETPAKPDAEECFEYHDDEQMNEVLQQYPELRSK